MILVMYPTPWNPSGSTHFINSFKSSIPSWSTSRVFTKFCSISSRSSDVISSLCILQLNHTGCVQDNKFKFYLAFYGKGRCSALFSCELYLSLWAFINSSLVTLPSESVSNASWASDTRTSLASLFPAALPIKCGKRKV